MNEQLQSKLVEILAGIQAATKTAGDFAMEQLPDIAQQYVMYGRVYTLCITLFCVAIFLCGFYTISLVNKAVKRADEEFANQSNPSGYRCQRSSFYEASDTMPMQYIPFLVGGVFTAMSLSQTLLAWFAPKVWLLKELASLIK